MLHHAVLHSISIRKSTGVEGTSEHGRHRGRAHKLKATKAEQQHTLIHRGSAKQGKQRGAAGWGRTCKWHKITPVALSQPSTLQHSQPRGRCAQAAAGSASQAAAQAAVHHLQEVGILQCCCHPLLVSQLLVDSSLRGVAAWRQLDVGLRGSSGGSRASEAGRGGSRVVGASCGRLPSGQTPLWGPHCTGSPNLPHS